MLAEEENKEEPGRSVLIGRSFEIVVLLWNGSCSCMSVEFLLPTAFYEPDTSPLLHSALIESQVSDPLPVQNTAFSHHLPDRHLGRTTCPPRRHLLDPHIHRESWLSPIRPTRCCP